MKRVSFSNHNKGIVAIILAALVFASMGIFVRYLKDDLLLFQQVYLRIFVAFFLALILFYKDLHFSKLKTLGKKDWQLIAFRGISMYIGVTLFSEAMLLTLYSNVSFISALPMVAILGVILLKEKITLPKVLWVLLSFVGVILVAVQSYADIFHWGTGELLSLASIFFFSLSYISRKFHTQTLNNHELTTLMFFFGGIAIFVFSLFAGEGIPSLQSSSNTFWLTLFLAGLFNVMNVYLTNYGFQKIDAILANNLLTLESLFAIILGFMFFQEVPAMKELFGGLLIIASVIGMNQLEKKTT